MHLAGDILSTCGTAFTTCVSCCAPCCLGCRLYWTKEVREEGELLLIFQWKLFAGNLLMSSKIAQEVLSSLQPQIYAIEILSKVAIRASNKSLFDTYQIAPRCVFLSSALEAGSRRVESCAALAMATWCSIEVLASSEEISNTEENVKGDPTSEEILLFPGNAVLDAKPRDGDAGGGGLASIFNRLTRAYIDCRSPPKENTETVPAGDLPLQILKDTLMGKLLEASCFSEVCDEEEPDDKSVQRLSLCKLLHSIVWNKKRHQGELSMTQAGDIVRTILKSSVRIAKNHPVAEGPLMHIIEELKLFLQTHTKRLAEVAASPAPTLQVFSSSLHVSLASRLVDSRLFFFPRASSWTLRKSTIKEEWERRLLKCACGHLHLAEKHLAPMPMDRHRLDTIRYNAQRAAVQLQHAILLEHLSLAKLSRGGRLAEQSSTREKYASAVSISG